MKLETKIRYYLAILLLSTTLLQLYIFNFANSEIDNVSRIFLATIAIGSFVYIYSQRRKIMPIAYMDYFLHSITFLIVNISFLIHMAILLINNSKYVISDGWIGIIVIMPAIWGIGLLLHAIGAFFSRGCVILDK